MAKKEYLNSTVIVHFIATSFDFFYLDRKFEIHSKKFKMFFYKFFCINIKFFILGGKNGIFFLAGKFYVKLRKTLFLSLMTQKLFLSEKSEIKAF